MGSPTPNFNRLARVYRPLEFFAYGRELERVRLCLLDQLRECRRILVLGEGDGRCLARLVEVAPVAEIHCVDASAAMIATAAARLPAGGHARVRFICADALSVDLGDMPYDAVVTLFFLDCFTTEQVEALTVRIRPHLAPKAAWLFADFVVPPHGWRRLRARIWLATLYSFFRWQTGLGVSALPDSEAVLERAGFARDVTRSFQHGLLRATLYRYRAN